MLNIWRLNLVTKEKVKKAYEGKLINDEVWKDYGGSINVDLERFLIHLQNQQVKKGERVHSFFTPKLTNEELKLVEESNGDHLKSYLHHYYGKNPDVDIDEMKRSDSKSKYVHSHCWRYTELLTLEQSQTKTSVENSKIRIKSGKI